MSNAHELPGMIGLEKLSHTKRRRTAKGRTLEVLTRRVRATCRQFAGVSEVHSWGHPTFVAKRTHFAVVEEADGVPAVAFKARASRRAELLQDPRVFVPRYGERGGWLAIRGVDVSAHELAELIETSYRAVTLVRRHLHKG